MKIKRLPNLHWLLMLFVAVCESTSVYNYHYSTGKLVSNSENREQRAAQLRKARSSPNNNLASLNSSASSLHKVSFLPEDSFEPAKRHFSHQKAYGSKYSNSNVKRDLTEPIGFLNAIVNDHATSSTNQESDTVRYPPNKAFKSLSSPTTAEQPFSRRQRDFSESPLNPTGSASDTSESMNSDDHESDSGSPFSGAANAGSSSGGQSSAHEDSPVDSNEDFPSPSNTGPSSPSGSSSASPSNLDDESSGGMPYHDNTFGGPSGSVEDEHHARGNSLDEEEQHSSHHPSSIGPQTSLSSRPPTLSYNPGPYGSNPYMSSPFGSPPQINSPFRGVYSGVPPISFPGYRPSMSNPLSYPLISSASSSPLAGSYKAMSSESYSSGPMPTKYRGYSPSNVGSLGSSFGPPSDDNSAMFSPFSFDSFPSSSDSFGSTPTNFGSFKSSSYGDLMGGLNNNWYLNQPYLPLMMKQAGYPMMGGGGYPMQYQQYQTTTQAATDQQDSTKEKDKETTGSKTKNRLRFNLNRLQAIRLNNLKLPSLFNWHKNSTTTTTQSSIN